MLKLLLKGILCVGLALCPWWSLDLFSIWQNQANAKENSRSSCPNMTFLSGFQPIFFTPRRTKYSWYRKTRGRFHFAYYTPLWVQWDYICLAVHVLKNFVGLGPVSTILELWENCQEKAQMSSGTIDVNTRMKRLPIIHEPPSMV